MRGRGGIPAVLRDLFASPLRERYRLSFISTYGLAQPYRAAPLRQLRVFPVSLVRIVRWSLRPGRRLVHVHAAVRGSWYRKAVCVAVVKAAGRPVVLHVHSGAPDIERFWLSLGPFRRTLIRRAFGLADQLLSVSSAGAEAIRARTGIEDVGVVPNAAPSVPAASAELPADDGALQVLYLGGFANPAKGGHVLLEAIRHLGGDERIAITLAGPGELPAEALAPFADGAAVRWAGWLEPAAKDAELRRAHVVVLPSVSEGVPVALLEALAYGRAVVATRVGGIPEIVTDGVDAMLVASEDRAGLADAIRALADDPDRRRALGRAARLRAERLNADEVLGRLDQVYGRLVGDAPPVPRQPERARRPAKDPLTAALSNRTRGSLFLCYHSVADGGPPWSSLPAAMFERHLAVLRRLGYAAGRHRDLAELAAGRRPARPLAFLTFDDGFRDNHETVLPLLREAGWTGIVFILPPAVEHGAPLDWPEVADRHRAHPDVMRSLTWPMVDEMVAAGIEFGSHTNTHPALTDLSDEALREELLDSRRHIIDRLGRCESLAYPFGAWSPRVAAAAADAGYTYAFTLPGSGQPEVHPLAIPRLVVDHRDEPWRFALKVQAPVRRLWFSGARDHARTGLSAARRVVPGGSRR